MTEQNHVTVGKLLQNRRVEIGLSIDDVAKKTRIQTDLLSALEEDRFDALPGEAYLYGFVKSYAECLSLAPDSVVAQLRAQLGAGEQELEQPLEETGDVPDETESRGRNWTILLLVIVSGLIVLVAVFMRSGTGVPERANVVVVAEQGAETSKEAAAEPPAVTMEKVSHLSVLPKEGALFRIKTSGPVAIQVEVDGRPKQDYDLPPETALSWRVEKSLRLHTDKPAAFLAWLDGEAIDMADAATLVLEPAEPVEGEAQ